MILSLFKSLSLKGRVKVMSVVGGVFAVSAAVFAVVAGISLLNAFLALAFIVAGLACVSVTPSVGGKRFALFATAIVLYVGCTVSGARPFRTTLAVVAVGLVWKWSLRIVRSWYARRVRMRQLAALYH